MSRFLLMLLEKDEFLFSVYNSARAVYKVAKWKTTITDDRWMDGHKAGRLQAARFMLESILSIYKRKYRK